MCKQGDAQGGPFIPWAAALCVLGMVGGVSRLARAGEAAHHRKKPKVVLRIYDVRSTTTPITNFVSPIHLPRLSSIAPQNPFAQQVADPERMSAADLATLLQERILAEDFFDQATSIQESGGRLVVMQTPAVHAKIKMILKRLAAPFLRRVSVQGLEIAVEPDEALRWLGRAGRPQPEARVAALLAKKSGARLLSAPQFVVFNKQRAYVLAGTQRSYVADMDISGSAHDPVVRSLLDGVILEGRPALDAAGETVELDLHFQRSRPAAPMHTQTFDGLIYVYGGQTIKRYGKPDPKKDKAGEQEKEGPLKEEIESNSTRILGTQRAVIELPRVVKRTLHAELRLPLSTWVLAGMLDAMPEGPKGGPAERGRVTLLFVRCEQVFDAPDLQ